mmetsp:Transcript_18655/g.17750  ORF Transcript_18655/g.17750 Transcript_18655/m.17750 type:complete len:188 (+) Transcript_18655:917-1480(+)
MSEEAVPGATLRAGDEELLSLALGRIIIEVRDQFIQVRVLHILHVLGWTGGFPAGAVLALWDPSLLLNDAFELLLLHILLLIFLVELLQMLLEPLLEALVLQFILGNVLLSLVLLAFDDSPILLVDILVVVLSAKLILGPIHQRPSPRLSRHLVPVLIVSEIILKVYTIFYLSGHHSLTAISGRIKS